MAIVQTHPVEQHQTLKALVQYFEPDSSQQVLPDEMTHAYYGVPVWLMKEYLVRIGANAVDGTRFERGACRMQVSPAPRKRIGSLQVGGATVEFTGRAGAIQEVLTELEWKTLRCGG